MTQHQNSVHLIGRLAATATVRELPSGDEAVIWRLIVERVIVDRPVPDARARVDTLACVSWVGGFGRVALAWQPGDIIEVEGALRRRFWRTPGGPVSRYEVEVAKARRVAERAQ